MLANCDCGTQVSCTYKQGVTPPLNMVCFSCAKSSPTQLYCIDYEIPPMRAVCRDYILSTSESKAIETLISIKDLPDFRKIKITQSAERSG